MSHNTILPNWILQLQSLVEARLTQRLLPDELYQLIETWFQQCPPPCETEESPVQDAIACLSAEVIFNMPPELRQIFDFRSGENEETLLRWISEVINLGRCFQEALDKGE